MRFAIADGTLRVETAPSESDAFTVRASTALEDVLPSRHARLWMTVTGPESAPSEVRVGGLNAHFTEWVNPGFCPISNLPAFSFESWAREAIDTNSPTPTHQAHR